MKKAATFNPSTWLQRTWPVLILLAFCATLYIVAIHLQHATFFINMDNVDQFYSWYQKLASSIHKGYLPLWDANTLSGHSFVGEFQQGVFYPLNILFCWLFGNENGIPITPLEILVMLHFFIASLGFYLFSRQIKLSQTASLCTGLIYAYSAALMIRSTSQTCIFFGLALIPLGVYFSAKFVNSKNKLWLALSGAILGLIILAGHIQPFFHGLLITLIFLLINEARQSDTLLKKFKSLLLQLAFILIPTIIIALPQIVLSGQYMSNAYRFVNYYVGPGEKINYSTFAKAFSMEPGEIFNIINPQTFPIKDGNAIFIGLGALALILVGIFSFGRQLRHNKRWLDNRLFIVSLIILGLMSMIGYWTFFAVVLYKLPFVYQIRQLARYAILVLFALSVLSGIIFDLITDKDISVKSRTRLLLSAIGAFALINSAYLVLLPSHIFSLSYGLQWLLASLMVSTIAVFINNKYLLRISILCLIIMNAALNVLMCLPPPNQSNYTYKSMYRSPIVTYLADNSLQYRAVSIDNALPPNIGDVFPIYTTSGYGATVYKPYLDYLGQSSPISDKTYDLLGAKYLVTKKPLPNLAMVMKDDKTGAYLYQRADYYPKIFTSDDIETGRNGKDIAALSRFKIVDYGDLKQTYDITLDRDSTVILSEINYPGWRGYIDDKLTDIKTAEIPGTSPLFKSIQVPAGTHRVTLKYLF